MEASKDFVNCYVELPRQKKEADNAGMMSSSLTVQFFTPGLRRLRVVDNPDETKLMGAYRTMLSYYEKLEEDERMQAPKKVNWPRSSGGGY